MLQVNSFKKSTRVQLLTDNSSGNSYYFNPSTKEIKYSWFYEEIDAILRPNMPRKSSAHEHESGTIFTLGSYETLVTK
jgi:hypothetical protein